MRILFLYNNENSLELYRKLRKIGEKIVLFSDRIDINKVIELNPFFIISYNYKYLIDEDVIKYMKNKIVNLHISLLPWNRGANPNLWSFIDNTPKGVTIHQVSAGLDEGMILLQKEVEFNLKKETFSTTYNKLNAEIVKLFVDNWNKIKNAEIVPKNQVGEGSYHKIIDYTKLKNKIDFTWDDNIYEFMQRYNKLKREGD